ncbi:uncharacterized protein LTR77_009222 [Saxophila tyrrhenica]|uniref:RRM domain-containing protein n=1 Tax=Saxophila tyrrhenica TaxID=1690608 RepID=A0AAV9P1B8_9PEZI|nr:hypothetical protein LTR77_009222 [Saxophila tyrrhenica]
MASVTDSKNTGYPRANNGYGNNMYNNQYGGRGHAGQGYGMHNPAADMAALTHGFQGMNLPNSSFAAQAKNAMMSTAATNYNGLPAVTSMPPAMYGAPNQYIFPNNYGGAGNNQAANMYTPHVQQYMPPMTFQGYNPHDNSPLSQQNWTPTTGATGEVPTLITPRRDSISSNENDQPTTPSYAGYPTFAPRAVNINRSPSGVYTHSTPSPTSMIGPYGMPLAKQLEQSDVSPEIKRLVSQAPSIPPAIPAPSSPLKPLDRALENQRGETNVYIRGLLPATSDEVLEGWGSRFGDIKSSKSIIDLNTGLCKGFGFIKYHNYEDAENCIRGFHYLGYEVSFARESFYSKLKAFSDEHNTNLYVSNLPKTMNEHELAQLFGPHKVCSSRILRMKSGHGRGVGFARFETRDACEQVIKDYNNFTIKDPNGEELQIQIRYADTQEQKSLKQQTQAARQFRSAEYEYATQAWRQGNLPYAGSNAGDSQDGNEFEQYLGTTANVPIQGQRWAQYGGGGLPGRSPLGGLPANTSQAPMVQINVASDAAHAVTAAEAADTKPAVTSPATAQAANSPVDSGAASGQE